MKNGNIAVATNPFGMIHKICEIKPVDDAHRAVTATRTPNRLDVRIIHKSLKISSALLIGTRKLEMLVEKILTDSHSKALGFKKIDSRFYLIGGNLTGRSHNADAISGMQIRRKGHGWSILGMQKYIFFLNPRLRIHIHHHSHRLIFRLCTELLDQLIQPQLSGIQLMVFRELYPNIFQKLQLYF